MKLYKELKLFRESKSVVPEGVYDIEQSRIKKAEEYLWIRLIARLGEFGPTQ